MKECRTKKLFAVREKRMLDSGITLIALVITIIILLILAGITINLALAPDGIVKRAQTAGDEYKDAQDKELSGLGKLENMLNEISDKIAENNGSTSGEGKDLSNVDASVIALKAGDYIKYDTGEAEVGENGVETFRVLYDLTSEHGLQIVANTNIGEEITLGGTNKEEVKASFNGAIVTLNTASENYINSTYASDARSVGSLPNIGADGKFTKKNNGTVEFDNLYNEHLPYYNSVNEENCESDCEVLTSDAFSDYDCAFKRGISFESEGDFNYWMASRGCDMDVPAGDDTDMGIYVMSGGQVQYCYCGDNALTLLERGGFYQISRGLRPVIALKYNDIKITEGNGSKDNPYIIGLK